jgi:hypothetical protein
MANVVKKYSISSELAQKMVDEAVAKASTILLSNSARHASSGSRSVAFLRQCVTDGADPDQGHGRQGFGHYGPLVVYSESKA